MLIGWVYLVLHKELNLGRKFDTVGYRASLMFFRVDWYFDFIASNSENATLYKCLVQKGRSMFKATSEIAGNPPLIPSQNSFNYFVKTLKLATQAAYFIFIFVHFVYMLIRCSLPPTLSRSSAPSLTTQRPVVIFNIPERPIGTAQIFLGVQPSPGARSTYQGLCS